MQVRYVIGGRDISYRIDVGGARNPFSLDAISQFKCPKGL
jgi:type VI secretion system protein ImpL